MSFYSGDKVKAALAAKIFLTAPGTPFVYYGEEIGMTGQKPDENIRTPMQWSSDKYAGFSTVLPWEPVNRNYKEFNVETESEDPDSLLNLYRYLIKQRNDHAGLRVGDFYTIRSENFSILTYLRASDAETLMVLINLSEEPVSGFTLSLNQGPLKGTYGLYPLEGESVVPDLVSNQNGGFDSYDPGIELPANEMIIYQLISR